MKVPRFDPAVLLDELGAALPAAMSRVWASGCFIGGEEVRRFEADAATFLGLPHSVGCGNGTDALELALRALELPAGSRVATSPFTFVATASAIVAAGFKPYFVDIRPETLQLDPATLEAVLSKVAAVVPVSLYGRPVDPAIYALCRNAGVPTVEDACQAFGAGAPGQRAGTLATAAAYSFFPTKPLGALGDAGLVVTAEPEVARRVRSLASHGFDGEKGRPQRPGRNSRLDALQAALLRAKLPHVEIWRQRRQAHAERYSSALGFVARPDAAVGHAWHQYAVRSVRRDELLAQLRRASIDAAVYYAVPLHRTPAFRRDVRLPVAESAAAEVICLPVSASLVPEQIDYVIDQVGRLA